MWIAQQVINDVADDGQVSIDGFNYAVNHNISEAIRLYPDVYRMGSIGPDAHPDPLVGQSFIHPGNSKGWYSDDWLKWLISQCGSDREALAYTYGFLAHAAGDVIGHSYINTYAGDVFDLTDGEQEVEVRHYALEHYVGKHTPALRDSNGIYVGAPYDVVRVPQAFVASSLILNDDVANQYTASAKGFHLRSMQRVSASIRKIHGKVAALFAPIDAEESRLKGLVIDANARIVQADKDIDAKLAKLPGLRDAEQAARLAYEAQIRECEPLEQMESELEKQIAIADEAIDRLRNDIKALNDYVNRQVDQALAAEQRAFDEVSNGIKSLTAAIDAAEGRIDAAQEEIDKLKRDIEAAEDRLIPGCSHIKWCKELLSSISGMQTSFDAASANLEIWKAALGAQKRALDDARAALQAHQDALDRLNAARKEALDRLKVLDDNLAEWTAKLQPLLAQLAQLNPALTLCRAKRDATDKAWHEALDLLTAAEALVQTLQDRKNDLLSQVLHATAQLPLLGAIDPSILEQYLARWEADIVRATEAYVQASAEVIIRTMQDRPVSEIVQPLGDWKDCWAPVFTGVPHEIPNTACAVNESFRDLHGTANALAMQTVRANFLTAEVYEVITRIEGELKDELVEAGVQIIDRWIGTPLQQLYEIHQSHLSEESLNKAFSEDRSNKRLLKFDDIASIARQDMAIVSVPSSAGQNLNAGFDPDTMRYVVLSGRVRNGIIGRVFGRIGRFGSHTEIYQNTFDAAKFAAVKNAVVLAKLALLSSDELNRIPANYGIQGPFEKYGPTLYPTDGTFVNILYRVAKVIDGNQQWQGCGWPPLRDPGNGPAWDPAADSDFGYPWSDTDERRSWGFRLWEVASLRSTAFARMFQVPLAPGIEGRIPSDFPRERKCDGSHAGSHLAPKAEQVDQDDTLATRRLIQRGAMSSVQRADRRSILSAPRQWPAARVVPAMPSTSVKPLPEGFGTLK